MVEVLWFGVVMVSCEAPVDLRCDVPIRGPIFLFILRAPPVTRGPAMWVSKALGEAGQAPNYASLRGASRILNSERAIVYTIIDDGPFKSSG